MRILSAMARTAAGMKHAYAIVFTGLLLYELVRFRFKKRTYDEPLFDRRNSGRSR